MRKTHLTLGFVVVCAGCVDAPITAEQLEADGQLRPSAQSKVLASERPMQRAVMVSAVLAAEATGPLADRSEFTTETPSVHLHLRADGLDVPRPVLYRWTYDDISIEFEGTIVPSEEMTLATSFELTDTDVGVWEVEVLTTPLVEGEPPQLLVKRTFEVKPPLR